jgi:hypothetical protein
MLLPGRCLLTILAGICAVARGAVNQRRFQRTLDHCTVVRIPNAGWRDADAKRLTLLLGGAMQWHIW